MASVAVPQSGTTGWGKVFVATRYQPQLPAWTCEALIGLVQFGMRPGDQRDYVYSKTMHKAANILVRKFLATDCDSICFIDSDAVFGSAALEELRSDERAWEYDVLQAFTVKRGYPPEPMYIVRQPVQPEGDSKERGVFFMTGLPLEEDFIYPVDAVSLHFTLIRRSLLERMMGGGNPEFTYWFEYNRDNGEDINFSIKAADLGARLAMSTRLKVGHVSEVVFGWDSMIDYYERKFAYALGEPKPSLNKFRPFWEAQKALASLVAEYTGEDADTVYSKALAGTAPLADRWERLKPRTPQEVAEFYNSPLYLYDLIRWNGSPVFQSLLGQIPFEKGWRVLDFGGGIGTVSEFLASKGCLVDYFDPAPDMSQFARFRFDKWAGRLPGQATVLMSIGFSRRNVYDLVVAIDVLEHIHPWEFPVVMRDLMYILKPGGVLFAHNNWSKGEGAYPQHYDNGAEFEQALASAGFEKIGEHAWRRPQ